MERGFFEIETAIYLGLFATLSFGAIALFQKSKDELIIKHKEYKNEWNANK